MKILHLDLVAGIAGDMALGALVGLGASLEPLNQALVSMGLEDVDVGSEAVRVNGLAAWRIRIGGGPEAHVHRCWRDIRDMITRAELSENARGMAQKMFRRLAEAEGRIHGVKAEEVEFHEVGAVDSIADILGVALAVDQLAPELITASPPPLGRGVVKSQHGWLPIPAPATLELLKGLPTRGGDEEQELTTPTGAAMLAVLVHRIVDWPEMRPQRIGYGAGSRQLERRPNILRAVLGESALEECAEIMLQANIDDMNPQIVSYVMERLLEAGALDVWWQPVVMKKSRPGLLLTVLGRAADGSRLEQILFQETTTIGLRRLPLERRKLERRFETVDTPWGRVRIKVAGEGGRDLNASPEYEDCRALAEKHAVALKEVQAAALQAWRQRR